VFPGTYASRITFPGYPLALADRITVAAWLKPDLSGLTGLGRLRILARQTNNQATYRSWVLDFGRRTIPTTAIQFRLLMQPQNNPAWTWHQSSNDVTGLSGLWGHYVVTWDSAWGYTRMGINGVVEQPEIDVNTPPAGTLIDVADRPFRIIEGETTQTQYPFKGAIADLRVYARAMTDAQMQALYAPATRWELYGGTHTDRRARRRRHGPAMNFIAQPPLVGTGQDQAVDVPRGALPIVHATTADVQVRDVQDGAAVLTVPAFTILPLGESRGQTLYLRTAVGATVEVAFT